MFRFSKTWIQAGCRQWGAFISGYSGFKGVVCNKWDDGHSNRIDLLCLDRTTRELVIVENKISGRNKTVITQYAKYKAWAKHHLDELNEKYKDKNLKATENLKVVIITDTTDGSMEITCKDENIPLIYIDGGVIFEEIVSYNNY